MLRRRGHALRLAAYTDATGTGGAEICLGYLLGALDPAIEATVLCLDEAVGAAVAAHRPGTAVELLPRQGFARDLRPLGAHLRALRRLRPDVLHVNDTHLTACGIGLAAGLLTPGVRVVLVEHVPLAAHLPARIALQRRLAHRRLGAHVAVGDRAAREVERRLGLPPSSVLGVANGVPSSLSKPTPGVGFDRLVAAAGRFTEQKGFDMLVRALALLPDARLRLVGDGPLRGELEALAGKLGVRERLEITGWRPDARALVAEATVLAVPSRWEGMPLVVLEAMADGLPVVASDVGSVGDAVAHGHTGFLVAPDDPEALARQLAAVLGDPALAARLGAAGREAATANFTAAAMARRYEHVYERTTRQPG